MRRQFIEVFSFVVFLICIIHTSFIFLTLFFSLLGTPNDQIWPGVSKMPDYRTFFPKWEARPLKERFILQDENGEKYQALDDLGINLLEVASPASQLFSFFQSGHSALICIDS